MPIDFSDLLEEDDELVLHLPAPLLSSPGTIGGGRK